MAATMFTAIRRSLWLIGNEENSRRTFIFTGIAFTYTEEDLVQRRKLNRAWEILRAMPMPAIASDRLVDLHNDLTDYDLLVAQEMKRFLRGRDADQQRIRVDLELEDGLRAFKTEGSAEVEGRRELLRYKRRIDDVVRELLKLGGDPLANEEEDGGTEEDPLDEETPEIAMQTSC